jgi:hypothetical protein
MPVFLFVMIVRIEPWKGVGETLVSPWRKVANEVSVGKPWVFEVFDSEASAHLHHT